MFNLKNKNDLAKRALASVLSFAIITQFSSGTVHALIKESSSENDKLKISVLSDPHFFPEGYVTNTENQQYKDYMAKELYLLNESAEIFVAALEKAAENKPDVLIIPGDMTKNGEVLGTEQVSYLLNEFEKRTGIDVFVISGNHDVYSGAFAFNGPNGDRQEIEDVTIDQYLDNYSNFGYKDENNEFNTEYFGDNEGEVIDTIHPELSYVARPKEGYVILGLNSQLYYTDENGQVQQGNGGFNEDLLSWAEKQIAKAEANGETVIAMTHHGIIAHSVASELSEGSAVVQNYEEVATRLADVGLRYIFTGHMHENDIAEFTTAKGNTLYDIETGSTAGYGSPLRTVEFEKNTTEKLDETKVKEKVTVSSESIKSTANIENLQQYIYDFIYEDSRYLEIKLGGALDSIVDSIANLNLYELIFGQATMTQALENSFGGVPGFVEVREALTNNTLSYEEKSSLEEFNFADELAISLAEAFDGKTIETEEYGQATLSYDDEDKEVIVTSNSRGIEEKLTIDKFLKDIVKQIDEKVLDKEVLKNEISNLITNILNIEVFETEDGEKKVLRDVINLFLIDHFLGAEDLTGWPQELLEQMKTGEGISALIDDLIDTVLGILPELLNKVQVNVKNLTTDFILQVGINAIIGKDKSLYNALTKLGIDLVDVIKNPIGEYLDSYITPSFEKQMGVLLGDVIYGLAGDDTQDDEIDGEARVITYEGVIPQEPTVENGLLPHSIAVTFGGDETTEKAFSWYTGKNVPNNELQIVKSSEANVMSDGQVDFINAITVKADSEVVKRSFPTLDLGLIAITKDKEVSRHKVLLEGLQSGTKYYYRVGNAENGVYSDVATFETAEVNDNSFTFLNFSDTQSMLESEYEGWEAVVDTAFNMYPDAKFVTHAGDMVDNGKNELQWQWFLNKPQEDLMNTTFIGASGNHEESGDFSQINHFNIQDIPEQDLTTGAYYKVDYGNVLVMVINTNNLDEGNALSEEQISWLKETVNASDAKWKVIQTHKAPYSNGSHYADEDVVAIREQLDPIVTELGIDFVLEGHDHTYARTGYLVNGETEEVVSEERVRDGITYETAINPEGTMYAITGTSGVKFYKPQETGLPIEVSKDIEVPVFAAITVDGDMLYYNAYTVNTETREAELLDTFAIEKKIIEADIVAPIITGVENEGKYYIDRTVAVSDNEGLESVTINGVEVNGKYEITASNEEKEYVVVATDNSGNKTEVKFTMAGLPSIDDITYGEASLNLINEIKSEFENVKNSLYGERVQYFNNYIAELEEAYEICESVIEDFIGKVEELPTAEEVTAEQVKEIKGILAIYRSLSKEEKAALGEEVVSKLESLELAIRLYSLSTVDNKVSVEYIEKTVLTPEEDTNNGYFDLGTYLIASEAHTDGEFEIKAMLDGIEAEVNGNLRVTMELGEFTFGENNKLYIISKDGLTRNEISANVVDGKLVFETTELGNFMIVELATVEQRNELSSLIEDAKSIETDRYTSATVKVLNEALENADRVLLNEESRAKEVLASIEEVKAAIEGLEEKTVIAPVVNKTELTELIEKLSTVDTTLYTKDSVNVFIGALEEAKVVLSNEDATQEEVNNAIDKLRKAVDGLVEKEEDGTENENGGSGSGSGSGNNGGSESGNGGASSGTNSGAGSTNNGNSGTDNLPKTGGVNSIFAVTLGALTAIGGALSLKKKRK